MDINIFSYLFVEDDEKRNMASSIVLEAMKNPEFLDFLVQSLSSIVEDTESMKNLFLIQSICVVLRKEIIKKKDNLSFFEDGQLYFCKKTLFEVVFKLPLSIRHYLVDILGFFFKFHKQNFDYLEIIHNCIKIIEENENIFNITTSLNLIGLWCCAQSRIGINQEREEILKQVIPLVSLLLKQTYSFLETLPEELLQLFKASKSQQLSSNCQKVDEENTENLKEKFSIIEAHFELIQKAEVLVYDLQFVETIALMDDFKEIITTFTKILTLDINGIQSFVEAKILISDLFCFKIHIFFKSEDFFSEESRVAINSFTKDVGPILVDSVLNGIQKCQESNLLARLLHVVYIYIVQGIFKDAELFEEIFTQILIPSSFLKNEDLQTFTEIPEQYIEFYLMLDANDANKMQVVRKIIAAIVSEIVRLLPLENIEHIFNCLMQPSSTVIEAEAKVYLNTVIFLFKDIPVNLTEATIQEFKENGSQMDDFYYASLLLLLSSTYKNEQEEEGKENSVFNDCLELGLFSLLNSNSQVIQICAIDLLDNIIDESFNPNSQIGSSFPLAEVVEAILNLASELQHELIGNFICKLINFYHNFFSDASLQFIEQLFNLWCSSKNDDDNGDKLSSILVSISSIIMKFPKNCEAICQLVTELMPAIIEVFQQSQNTNGFKELIDILGCLSDQIDEPPSFFYDMILMMILEAGFSASENENKEDEDEDEEESVNDLQNSFVWIYIQDFSVVICSLICRKNFFENENAVNTVVKIIENLMNCADDERMFSSGLIIITCLIQSADVTSKSLEKEGKSSFDSSQFIQFALKAAEFIENFNETKMDETEEEDDDEKSYDSTRRKDFFILSVITLSSALIANEEVAIQMMNEKIFINWILNYKLSFNVGEKLFFIHWSTIALLILSKYDFDQHGLILFKIAVDQFLKIKEIELSDNENDNLISLNISYFPFQNITADKMFKDIPQDNEIFQCLSKEKFEKLQEFL